MDKRPLTLLGLAFIFATLLGAVPLTASWVEGPVYRKSGAAWQPLILGDKLDSGEAIRVGLGGTAEFKGTSGKIALSAQGVFNLDVLPKKGTEATQKRSSLLYKLGKIVSPAEPVSTETVGGMRGSEAGSSSDEGLSWAGEEGGETRPGITEARTLLAAAILKKALLAGLFQGDDREAAQALLVEAGD